jgi:chloramphenicol O-acetyltransferase type A
MTGSDAFSYCAVEYCEAFPKFRTNAEDRIERSRQKADIDTDEGRHDLLYVTSIPWISFTGVTHAMRTHPSDSIPRIAWGKYFESNGRIMLPLSVSAHHALVDGLHIGKYFGLLQEYANDPARFLK